MLRDSKNLFEHEEEKKCKKVWNNNYIEYEKKQ